MFGWVIYPYKAECVLLLLQLRYRNDLVMLILVICSSIKSGLVGIYFIIIGYNEVLCLSLSSRGIILLASKFDLHEWLGKALIENNLRNFAFTFYS